MLAKAIVEDELFAPDAPGPDPSAASPGAGAPADFAPYRLRYHARQQAMEAGIATLRENVRTTLAAASPRWRGSRPWMPSWSRRCFRTSAACLSTVPALLQGRFEALRGAGPSAAVGATGREEARPRGPAAERPTDGWTFSARTCRACCSRSWSSACNRSRRCSRRCARAQRDSMDRSLHHAAFLAALAAVGWVAAGYVGSNPWALTLTALIAAFFVMGALELQRFRAATATLSRALADLPDALPALGPWLARLHPSLQNAVRLRIEGERVALPGPSLTPYLAGLLVLLGMLGTFLGMVVTLNGTGRRWTTRRTSRPSAPRCPRR
jgi:hypothetical protein